MKDFNTFISFLKTKGFVYPSSEIYGGLANSWDYGPLGILLKDNIKNLWKEYFIFKQNNSYLFDSAIILNNKVWESSGHLNKFNDYVIECLNDNKRYKIEKLIEEYIKDDVSELSISDLEKYIKNNVRIPKYKEKTKWGEIKKFNLMFKINDSKTDDNDLLYLRPETAQGIFINFKNIIDTMHLKLPFNIGQIGKSFRNEVTPGNFIFKTREFEQLELEMFVNSENDDEKFNDALEKLKVFLKTYLMLEDKNLKFLEVSGSDLAHYSKKTIDVEYKFPFGYGEILGLANRGNFDLTTHKQNSKENIFILDSKTNNKIIPTIIEHSMGVERLLLAILCNAYFNENDKEILRLPYKLAPYKFAIMPLTKDEEIEKKALSIYNEILANNIFPITYENVGNIGKRYFKQDAIGTPFIITIDFLSLKDDAFTVRWWNNEKEQERKKLTDLNEFIKKYAK